MNIMKFPKREEGQGLVEYALVLVLVAIVVIIILTLLGSSIVLVYGQAIGGLSGQTISGTGNEGIVLGGDLTDIGGGNCIVSGQPTVMLTQDGSIVTDQTVSGINFDLGGSSGTGSVSINNSGTGSATVIMPPGPCTSNLKITGW